MAVTTEFRETVATGLERDREHLFDIADNFLDYADTMDREYAAWAICAPSGHYVNHYLRTLCELSGRGPAELPPAIHIASADIAHYPYQQDAIRTHVSSSGLAITGSNVLLVMGAIGSAVEVHYPRNTLIECGAAAVDIFAYAKTQNIRGFGLSIESGPWLTSAAVTATTGQECVFGRGEPVEPEGFDPTGRQYIEQAIGLVAQQFVYERESR